MEQDGLRALEAAADCVARARYVVALTGAGLSVESGIPPVRGPGGLWAKDLRAAPPTPGHLALVELEDAGVLRALITQNVDNLHRLAGSRRLLEIHGNAHLILRLHSRQPLAPGAD